MFRIRSREESLQEILTSCRVYMLPRSATLRASGYAVIIYNEMRFIMVRQNDGNRVLILPKEINNFDLILNDIKKIGYSLLVDFIVPLKDKEYIFGSSSIPIPESIFLDSNGLISSAYSMNELRIWIDFLGLSIL